MSETHWEGCERAPGHHGCAIAKLDAAEAALETACNALHAIVAAGEVNANDSDDLMEAVAIAHRGLAAAHEER